MLPRFDPSQFWFHLRPVHCPACSTLSPALRCPRTWRQFLFGGWTCRACGTPFDKWGRPLAVKPAAADR